MKRDMTLKRKWLAAMLVAAALMFGVGQQAMAQTKQAVVVGSSGNVTAVKDGTADAVSTSDKTYVETTSGNTVTITTAAPPAGKVAKVTVKSYTVTSASDAKVPVTALTVTGTGGATVVSKGSTLQMTATAAPTYADWKDVTVTWSITSGSDYATINTSTGVLTGTAEGEVVVTATATDGSGVTGQCTVTVVKPIPAGAIRGKFTINASGEQVYFSQGNLQATTTDNGANWSWGFATNQWDLIGNEAANNAISGNGTVSENGTVDLFGWSTDATTYGINNSTNGSDYSGEFVDWGTLAITNGGNTENSGWRTLSKDEWNYLFFTRESGSKVNGISPSPDDARYAHAIINTADDGTGGVKGMILFPDGVTIHRNDVKSLGNINAYSNWDYATKCTTSQWNALAAKGFVFLPTGGVRNGTTVNNPYKNGYYWSSYTSSSTSTYAYYTRVVSAVEPTTSYDPRYCGFAVRLVKNVVGSISFTKTSVVMKPGDGAFTNPLTNTGDGTVTYSSSGDNICTVNETTGEVTLNGDLGTCTITATVADGSIYTYALHTVSYTLTVKEPFPVGDGKFSVSSTQKVYFAKGNLQATYYDENYSDETPGTWSWAFATNQWEYIGGKEEDNGTETGNNFINGNGTLSKNGTVDLFGWSTAATYYGIHNSKTGNDYSGDFVDWGNIIGPGSGWRTLTKDEWTWLLGPNGTNCRTSSKIGETENARFAKAKLFDTTHGLIIFPDSYTHPDGVAVPTGINETDGTSWNANTYNATDWGKMEAAGCVFLPVAGRRSGTNIRYVGYYWSATPEGTDAYLMQFGEGTGDTGTNAYTFRYMGNVVRLVKNAN